MNKRPYTLRPVTLKPIATAKHQGDDACPDAGWRALTGPQKRQLAILARKAAVRCGISEHEADEWRQEQAVAACGVRISRATQAHWADLQGRFQDLAGSPEKAFRVHVQSVDAKRRVAMFKLTEALAERELETGYAEKICRTQFKCGLEGATAKQIWCLFYTVRNRRKI